MESRLSILFIKNLTYNLPASDLFPLFAKFGPIRQIRQGTTTGTKGTAFVVYDEVADAKQACDKLNGFNFMGRYLVVLYHQPEKMTIGKLADRNGGMAGLGTGAATPATTGVRDPMEEKKE